MSIGKRPLFAALACLLLLSSLAGPAAAQQGVVGGEGRPVPLMADPNPSTHRVRPPAEAALRAEMGMPSVTATINVNFMSSGSMFGNPCGAWSGPAQSAFAYAASLWAAKLQSPVTITVNACWASLGPGVLGSAGPVTFARDFAGAPQAGTWYPIALANALAGSDLNTTGAEINASFSSAFVPNWYFGTDGNTPFGQYDFVSVVMHELGHGLGFLGSMDYSGGVGSWGSGTAFPFIYDRFTENGSNQALITAFANNSTALGSQLISNNLFFDGPNARSANGNTPAALYAPATWNDGSSYSHLAESFNNTPNSLMTFSLASGESNHDPGPVAMGILQDSGWALASVPPSPGSLSLNLTNTLSSFPVTTGSTVFSVSRSGGASGAVTGNLGITGGCTLSAASVSFADGSFTASPLTVTASAGTAVGGATCTITLTAVSPATLGTPSTHNIGVFVPDAIPDAFSFPSASGVVPETLVTSNAVTPTGFNVSTTISVVNGAYSIGCTDTYVTSAGTINPGESVCVRHNASASFGASFTTTLTIGGVGGTFTSTTVSSLGSALSNGVAVTSLSGTAGSPTYFYIDVPAFATNLTVQTTAGGRGSDLSLYVRRDGVPTTLVHECASATVGTTAELCSITNPPAGRYYILLYGAAAYSGVNLTATYVVVVPDTTPDAFSFTAQADVPTGSLRTSNTITPAGYNTAAAISVANGEYSIGCSTFTASAGTINPGQTVCVRHTSSGSNSTTVTTTLTIGGVNGTFSSTTVAPPNPGALSLNTSATAASITTSTGSTTFAVARTGGTLGAVSGNLGVTGGCTLSVASVSFADGSTTPSPATVTVSAGSAAGGATCMVTLTAVGPATTGAPNAVSIAVTNPPAVGTALSNGVAVLNLSGATGSATYFYIDVPSGATSLVVQTSGGGRGANADLFVRRDAVPTTGAFDCASVTSSSTETCSFTSPPAGRYFILLQGTAAFSAVNLVATFVAAPPPSPGTLALSLSSASIVEGTGSANFSVARTGGTLGAATGSLGVSGGCTLSAASVAFADGSSTPSPATVTVSAGTAVAGGTCTVTLSASGASLGSPGTLTVSVTSAAPPPTGTPLSNGVAVTGLAGAAGSSTYFYIDVPSGSSSLLVQTSGGSGGKGGTSNVNLYVMRDSVPTTSVYDCASTGSASTESCPFTNPPAGRYFVLLHGGTAYSAVNLVATFVATPPPNPGTLALNLSGTMASMRVTTGSTTFSVTRSGGTLGAVSANLGVTGGCTLSAPSVAFADGSTTPSPIAVTVSAGTAIVGATCTVTLTAVGATTGSPSSHSIAITSTKG
ncbi:MAG: PPC domain-containing protein [Burkholderiales bacterium]|nr:PPC domain-containing protein [Burkholderiales bacterium]